MEEDKTPNDLAWEALASSAPLLIQHVETMADEFHVAEEPEDRQLDTGDVINDEPDEQDMFDPIVEEKEPQENASGYEAAEGISPEESGDDDGKEK